jgi:hypothetical protein
LGNLNSLSLDFVARQKIGGTHLTFFIMEQLPILVPSAYAAPALWSPDEAVANWVSLRVLELTYTAWDMQGFARDLGYDGPPFPWDPERRFLLRAELDAAFFHLYGVPREEVDYILDAFPILRRKDGAKWGEYRTKRVVLEIYDAIARAIDKGECYETVLNPPPADARVANASWTPTALSTKQTYTTKSRDYWTAPGTG